MIRKGKSFSCCLDFLYAAIIALQANECYSTNENTATATTATNECFHATSDQGDDIYQDAEREYEYIPNAVETNQETETEISLKVNECYSTNMPLATNITSKSSKENGEQLQEEYDDIILVSCT